MKIDGIVPRPIYFVVAIFYPDSFLTGVYEPWNDDIQRLKIFCEINNIE